MRQRLWTVSSNAYCQNTEASEHGRTLSLLPKHANSPRSPPPLPCPVGAAYPPLCVVGCGPFATYVCSCRRFNFNCSAYSYDNGDCSGVEEGCSTTVTTTTSTLEPCTDCNGFDCAGEIGLVGNGVCNNHCTTFVSHCRWASQFAMHVPVYLVLQDQLFVGLQRRPCYATCACSLTSRLGGLTD